MVSECFNRRFSGLVVDLLEEGGPHDSTLYLYVGGGSVSEARGVRDIVPSRSFLLYLFIPGEADDERLFESRPIGEYTVFLPLSDELVKADLLFLIINCLKSKKVNLSISEKLRGSHGEWLEALKVVVDQALLSVYHEKTSRLIKFRCALHNLPSIVERKKLEIKLKDPNTSVLVCGAGPSIKTQFELIRRYRERIVVITVGRMAPVMIDAGIVPDFAVCVDPELLLDDNLAGDFSQYPELALVAGANVSPTVASKFSRIVWCEGDSLHFNKILADCGVSLEKLSLSFSAMIMGIDFAVSLGTQKIALLGSDLCLTEKGFAHLPNYNDSVFDQGGDRITTPGKSGLVTTTREFLKLKVALEDYLKTLPEKLEGEPPSVLNASAWGSHVECAPFVELDAFLGDTSEEPYALEISERDRCDITKVAITLGRTRSDIDAYGKAVKDCVTAVRRYLNAVAQKATPEQIVFYKKAMAMTIRNEERLSALDTLKHWLALINEQVDEWLFESPDFFDTDREHRLLRVRGERLSMIGALCDDFDRDLGWILSDRQNNRERKNSPIVFSSFRQVAVDVVGRFNIEFSTLLGRRHEFQGPNFDLYLDWVNPPYVRLDRKKEELVPLCPDYMEMDASAAREIARFTREIAFSPMKQAVVMPAPGNWLYVVEFAVKNPNAELMVIEPWPGLLSQIVEYSMFFHVLPRNMVVVVAHDDLPDWSELLKRTFDGWEALHLTPVVFEHPILKNLPELDGFYTEFRRIMDERKR